jgi:hypothetical protein
MVSHAACPTSVSYHNTFHISYMSPLRIKGYASPSSHLGMVVASYPGHRGVPTRMRQGK